MRIEETLGWKKEEGGGERCFSRETVSISAYGIGAYGIKLRYLRRRHCRSLGVGVSLGSPVGAGEDAVRLGER